MAVSFETSFFSHPNLLWIGSCATLNLFFCLLNSPQRLQINVCLLYLLLGFNFFAFSVFIGYWEKYKPYPVFDTQAKWAKTSKSIKHEIKDYALHILLNFLNQLSTQTDPQIKHRLCPICVNVIYSNPDLILLIVFCIACLVVFQS